MMFINTFHLLTFKFNFQTNDNIECAVEPDMSFVIMYIKVNSVYCFTSLSAQSLQYLDRELRILQIFIEGNPFGILQ